MVKDKASLEAFKDFVPSEDLKKPPGGASKAAAAPAPAAPAPAPPVVTQAPPPPPQPSVSAPAPQAQPARATNERIFASPLAKKLASERNIDLSTVQGSGPENHIIAQDILNYVAKTPAPKPTAQQQQQLAGEFSDIALNNFRSVTAKRLLLSKQTIPHYYLTIDLELDNALK
jgi:pyruvate dehydrogenase E2 component (dihydrolipoamide acetyltransferase)